MNNDEKKRLTEEVIEKMGNDGLTTICIAYKDLGKEQQNWDDDEKIINDLVCIAIVGIEDSVRKEVRNELSETRYILILVFFVIEVPDAIEKCQKAGVVVRMVTGDNIMTARSIATKCGIIKPMDGFLALEGKEFNKRIRDASGRVRR